MPYNRKTAAACKGSSCSFPVFHDFPGLLEKGKICSLLQRGFTDIPAPGALSAAVPAGETAGQ